MKQSTNIEITSVVNFILSINKYIKEDGKDEFFFRGQASAKYKLCPGIYRGIDVLKTNLSLDCFSNTTDRNKYYEVEENFYNKIISDIPEEFKEEHLTIEKLVKMQHFGIPTRLLDVTKNPLVALFFSCKSNIKEEDDEDGTVFFFNEKRRNIKFYNSNIVTILANLIKLDSDYSFKVFDNSDVINFNKQDSVKKLISYIREDKPYFEANIHPNDISKCVFFEPKYNTQRLIRQSGAFIIFGYAYENKQNKWLLEKQYDFIIPKKYKSNILKELDVLGINESTLFPDLENKGKYLKEKYSNKWKKQEL